eukprot:m.18769 g.18769  ORF g.18769 m.18769 type:complete len:88 (-) comp3370_c0_seq1:1240-1503(-)
MARPKKGIAEGSHGAGHIARELEDSVWVAFGGDHGHQAAEVFLMLQTQTLLSGAKLCDLAAMVLEQGEHARVLVKCCGHNGQDGIAH